MTAKLDESTSLEVMAIPKPKEPTQRHLARRTFYAGLHHTSQILKRSKSTLGVVKFGIETMEKLVEPAKSFTAHKWSTYGDPLLSKLDAKIDKAFFVLANATSPTPLALPPLLEDDSSEVVASSPDEEMNKLVYFLYWGRLKEKFMSSQWFLRCNHILMQNSMVQAVTQKVYQPAETFYNTVTEEFVANQSIDQYLDALKKCMGPTWDDRLTPLARAFYTTAQAVTAIVGAGSFMGGAFQLGKSRIHTAIDDLLTRWDQVLGVTDDMLDQWLPEKERKEREEKRKKKDQIRKTYSEEKKTRDEKTREKDEKTDEVDEKTLDEKTDEDEDETTSTTSSTSSTTSSSSKSSTTTSKGLDPYEGEGIFTMDLDEEKEMEEDLVDTTILDEIENFSKKRSKMLLGGGLLPLSTKLRQNFSTFSFSSFSSLPQTLLTSLSIELHKRLSPSWFSSVDDVLLQNALVRALSQGVIRPAEHFFTTAVESFRSFWNEWDPFIQQVKAKLGTTWDDRLWEPAKSFFRLASSIALAQAGPQQAPSITGSMTSDSSSGSKGSTDETTVAVTKKRRKKGPKTRKLDKDEPMQPVTKMTDVMSGLSITPERISDTSSIQ